MPARALLLDLDGTLADSNTLHVTAFRHAFSDFGYQVHDDRIAIEVGKGGDQLIPSILGPEAYEKKGQAISNAYLRHYEHLCNGTRMRLFPHTLKLLKVARDQGLKLALATSSKSKQLDMTFGSLGTDLREHVDVFTTADEADNSKPSPDIFLAAANKLGLHPAQCIAVGDTVYDARASRHAGATSVGLTTWTADESQLRSAGARVVARDTADLLARLPEILHACSPQKFDLDEAALNRLLQPAFDAARDNLNDGGAPIAAALFDGAGRLIATGANQTHRTNNPLHHAEITCLQNATGKFDPAAKDLLLASTLEPCVMCTGAAMESAIDTLLFALTAPADNGSTRVTPPQSPEATSPRTVGRLRVAEARALFEDYLAKDPPEQQAAFVRQLLALT